MIKVGNFFIWVTLFTVSGLGHEIGWAQSASCKKMHEKVEDLPSLATARFFTRESLLADYKRDHPKDFAEFEVWYDTFFAVDTYQFWIVNYLKKSGITFPDLDMYSVKSKMEIYFRAQQYLRERSFDTMTLAEVQKAHNYFSGYFSHEIKPEKAAEFKDMLELTQMMIRQVQENREVITVVATLYEFIINEKPFPDGNVRIARLLAEKAINSRGMSSPMWDAVSEGKGINRLEAHDYIMQAVQKGVLFNRQVNQLYKLNYDFRSIIPPMLTGATLSPLGLEAAKFSPMEFATWVMLKDTKPAKYQEAIEGYLKWRTELNKEGEGLGLFSFTDPAMMEPSHNASEYATKVSTFYTNQFLYRGGMVGEVLTEGALLRYMVDPKAEVSVPVAASPRRLTEVLREWDRQMVNNPEKFLGGNHINEYRQNRDAYLSFFKSSERVQAEMIGWIQKVESQGAFSTMEVKVRERKQAVLKTEGETHFLGGIDPESITQITFRDYVWENGAYEYAHVERVLSRINHNTVELSVTKGVYRNETQISRWEITENGGLKQLY